MLTEPVMMDWLAGAEDDVREVNLQRLLTRFPLLPFDAPTDFDGAVRVYRRCRRAEITPRGMIDCLIATVASAAWSDAAGSRWRPGPRGDGSRPAARRSHTPTDLVDVQRP